MKWSCTLCGSRDWPSKNTSCPLCRDYSDGEPSELEDCIDESAESDTELAQPKTKPKKT